MIDYHCHILPGIDDGAVTSEESLAMAQLLVAAGFTTVHCTPHCIRGLYEPTPTQVRAAVAALQLELDRAALPLQLLPGMEYCLDEFFAERLFEPLTLGASRLLLVEIPSQGDPERIAEGLWLAKAQGLQPLLAHPERSRLLDSARERQRWSRLWGRPRTGEADSELLKCLCDAGVLLQGNLGSLAGYYGPQVRTRALKLAQQRRYHCFGTDAHAVDSLRSYLAAGLQAAASC